MTLGDKIYNIRTSHNMSQEQLGELLGASRQTVSKWELDQVVPEIRKLIAISRLFCVSMDELLLTVSNFQNEGQRFVCGVYCDDYSEIVETERLALFFYKRGEKIIGAQMYDGNGDTKYLISACEKNIETQKCVWAYAETGKPDEILKRHSNDKDIERRLGEKFDQKCLERMKLQSTFLANHGEFEVRTVKENGIKQCLFDWRKGSKVTVYEDGICAQICIGDKEYIYKVKETDEDIYCGISYNVPFELGLRSYGQYFRLRNYKDNSREYCKPYCNFAYTKPEDDESFTEVNLGCVVKDKTGNYAWYVKCYSDTEIVLAGCGGEEYRYKMNDTKYERFV